MRHLVNWGTWMLLVSGGAVVATACGDSGESGALFREGPDGSADAASGGAAGSGVDGSGATGADAASGGAAAADGSTSCPDADGDGETTCEGDCDDGDPNNFGGNLEQCGDAADNDCDTMADEGCGGLGTYVSDLVGSDANPGTQQSPVKSLRQGMANAQTIGGGVDVFVAEGTYAEKVTLVEGVSLLGGHACDTSSCTWARDPKATVSTIQSTDAEGVVAGSSITRATAIDGFEIVGQDGAGTGDGRSALRIAGGSPTVTNDVIRGPDVSGGDFRTGRSFGILLQGTGASPGALIQGNEIHGGRSSDNGSDALAFDWSGMATGWAEIRSNLILGGEGRGANGLVAWRSGAGTLVVDNDVSAGRCIGSNGRAWGIIVGSELDVVGNRVNLDAATAGACASTNFSGGLQSESSTSSIVNNVIRGVDSPRSVGVMLAEFEMPAGTVVLNGNTIDGSGPSPNTAGGSRSHAMVLTIGTCTMCGFNARVGRIRNNVLLGGAAPDRFGVWEEAPSGRTQEPEAFENNLLWLGASPSGASALYREWGGNQPTLHRTLAAVNGLSIPSGNVSGNLEGDPLLDATYHLGAGSPAMDAGTATEAPPDDMDGDARPKGAAVDIGADER